MGRNPKHWVSLAQARESPGRSSRARSRVSSSSLLQGFCSTIKIQLRQSRGLIVPPDFLLVLLVALLGGVFGMKYPADPDHLRLSTENLSQLAMNGGEWRQSGEEEYAATDWILASDLLTLDKAGA